VSSNDMPCSTIHCPNCLVCLTYLSCSILGWFVSPFF
jgi:hypothetical protein